ncbi:MAG: Gfo/Idh/MocA family oxidoreductase [Planctomycetaceae bacterium]|nr:Gfo/Idh/MocA family oxidoreductase [Planctomycetaceae bacterium]
MARLPRKSGTSRRDFLKTSAAAAFGAAFVISGTKSSGRVLGANDRVRIAVAGLNGRGRSHTQAYLGMKDVEFAYLVDPDTRTYAKHLSMIDEAKRTDKPEQVQDIRKALEDKNLDAVSIATPNHWHSLMTIWACQAGKDVYVEKPCSHNVHEGRIAVEAARKYGRVVQHGTQSRASKDWAALAAAIEAGQFGKLVLSRGLCYKRRKSIDTKPVTPPPAELDFNLWLGPAPEQPHHGNLVHYNWHWFWDFGNGDVGNQGVHQMDVARWMIPGATLPKSVVSVGGRVGYVDQGETPNTQIDLFDFGDTKLLFETRGLETVDFYGQKIGNTLHFEDGSTIAGGKIYRKGSTEGEKLPELKGEAKTPRGRDIFRNFVEAIRSRDTASQYADILEGHYSSALCHLGNISYRLGEIAPYDAQAKAFGDDKDAYEALARMQEHLTTGNHLKLEGEKFHVGKKLDFDPATEKFVGNAEATAMLTRNYRSPFSVPDQIA